MHQMFCMGACEMFRTLECSTVSEKINIGPATPVRPQRPSNKLPPLSPHPTPAPYAEQISNDSTFSVLHFNANRIVNKLTELGVVLERNMVKSGGYTGVKALIKIQERLHPELYHGGGLLIFIHRSITFSKQPLSPEALSDPHLEELTIKADIGNTK